MPGVSPHSGSGASSLDGLESGRSSPVVTQTTSDGFRGVSLVSIETPFVPDTLKSQYNIWHNFRKKWHRFSGISHLIRH